MQNAKKKGKTDSHMPFFPHSVRHSSSTDRIDADGLGTRTASGRTFVSEVVVKELLRQDGSNIACSMWAVFVEDRPGMCSVAV
jgi:hypothetical protein